MPRNADHPTINDGAIPELVSAFRTLLMRLPLLFMVKTKGAHIAGLRNSHRRKQIKAQTPLTSANARACQRSPGHAK
jgi:hypothetical protein